MNKRVPDPHASDMLILVDEEDLEIGSLEKITCHGGQGILHRAFSVFLFDRENRLLIQQRSPDKMLWSGYWSNSCCSHPRLSDKTDAAAHRRVREELGVACCTLRYLYKFIYRAEFRDVGSEYEMCWVFVGKYDGGLAPDPSEVSATRFLTPDELTVDLERNSTLYTPWLKLEWECLRKNFPACLATGCG